MQLIEQIKRSVNRSFNSVKLKFVLKSNVLFPFNLKDRVTAHGKVLSFIGLYANAIFAI